MKVKMVLAAVAAGLLLTAGSCQSTQGDSCEWDLEKIGYSAKGGGGKGGGAKGSSGHGFSKPAPGRSVGKPKPKPQKPHTTPHGKVWVWDCD